MAKGIRYFNRAYNFSDSSQADAAEVALSNIASGSKTGALIATAEGQLLITHGVDVVLFG